MKRARISISNPTPARAFPAVRRSLKVSISLAIMLAACAISIGCFGGAGEELAVADESSRRHIAEGEVVGFASEPDAHSWLGIPFAMPPVGELRWRAPRSPDAWEGARETLAWGRSCMQFVMPGLNREGSVAGGPSGSEDCLTLNIFAPRFAPADVPTGDARLPVMYWIHGGGNTVGDATLFEASLLASSQKLIVVSVQYRLGVFGWFSHPALRGGGTTSDDRSGNHGTLDLVRGLEWVQENIAAFGGDPNRVTVFGESAGGSNTFSMLLSPRAAGLFQRAIVQSGSPRTTPIARAENFTDDREPGDEFSSGEVLLRYLIRDGRATDRASAKSALASMSGSEIAAYLREMSAEDVLAVYEGGGMGGMYSIPRLIADGRVLPSVDPLEAFASGKYNRVPTILGTNRDENRLFMLFGSDHVKTLLGIPLWLENERLFVAESEYQTKMWKVRGVDAPATRMRASQGPSVYAYRFDWDEEPEVMWLDLSVGLGAAHSLEIPFVFGWLTVGPATRLVFDPDLEATNRELSDAMMSYWAQFAYAGDPGRGRDEKLPEWNTWSVDAPASQDNLMIFDSSNDQGVRMAPGVLTRESRMAPGVLTRESVLEEIVADPRFETELERCRLYRSFVRWGATLSPASYSGIEDWICLAYPLDEFPWAG